MLNNPDEEGSKNGADADRDLISRIRDALPDSLRTFVTGRTWTRITIGMSPSDTFRLGSAGRQPLFLKAGPKSRWRELLSEKERLRWLQGRLPVPEVVGYAEDDLNEYLLLSAIRGQDAASLTDDRLDEDLVRLLARGLRTIHAVPTMGCPFDMTLDKVIERTRYNLVNGLVDQVDFDDRRIGRSAEDLFEGLLSTRPAREDLVFTHGDYCLPNVIIEGDSVAGFVDWGRAGVADRYKDIALVARSLERNRGNDLQRAFFAAYGIASPDVGKVEFYMLLDEFC